MLTKDIEMNKVQSMYETERLEQQVGELSKENVITRYELQQNRQIMWIIFLASILVLFAGFIIFRQSRISARHEKLLIEQRLLRSQMNPHFIFNSLASIQNFIVKQDDTRASIYLSRFSELIRSILHHSRSELISLEDELNTIENYLKLQKIRFSDEFDYYIEMNDELDIENLYIPPMLAQPFIENAIEHGIRHKTSKGNISIRFKSRNDTLILEIEDDGIGREKAMELMKIQNPDHTSYASKITSQRIKTINKRLKKKIRFEIIDIKETTGTGTKVIFEIPLPLNI
jgi:LytS/YehU family sensor histidine kinase